MIDYDLNGTSHSCHPFSIFSGVRSSPIVACNFLFPKHCSSKPPAYSQIGKLEGFLVECSPDGTTWVKSWDTAINATLPRAVRVTLRVQDRSRVVDYTALATLRMAGP